MNVRFTPYKPYVSLTNIFARTYMFWFIFPTFHDLQSIRLVVFFLYVFEYDAVAQADSSLFAFLVQGFALELT